MQTSQTRFEKSYIEKCKQRKVQDEIQYLVNMGRGAYFAKGDAIFHPYMDEVRKDFEIVKEAAGSFADNLYCDDPMVPYPSSECFLIPTVAQLQAGLEAVSWNLAEEDFEQGEEHLLDITIESRFKNKGE